MSRHWWRVGSADRSRRFDCREDPGRPKDLEDAKALWRLHGNELDTLRIREILGQLEEALAQSDLMPAFEALSR